MHFQYFVIPNEEFSYERYVHPKQAPIPLIEARIEVRHHGGFVLRSDGAMLTINEEWVFLYH